MVTNKLFLINSKHYLIHGGDVYLVERNKALAWVNMNPGFVVFHGKVVGQNFKLKKGFL